MGLRGRGGFEPFDRRDSVDGLVERGNGSDSGALSLRNQVGLREIDPIEFVDLDRSHQKYRVDERPDGEHRASRLDPRLFAVRRHAHRAGATTTPGRSSRVWSRPVDGDEITHFRRRSGPALCVNHDHRPLPARPQRSLPPTRSATNERFATRLMSVGLVEGSCRRRPHTIRPDLVRRPAGTHPRLESSTEKID